MSCDKPQSLRKSGEFRRSPYPRATAVKGESLGYFTPTNDVEYPNFSMGAPPLTVILRGSPGRVTFTSTLSGRPGPCGVCVTERSGASAASEMRMLPSESAVALRQPWSGSADCARLQTVTTSPACNSAGAIGTMAPWLTCCTWKTSEGVPSSPSHEFSFVLQLQLTSSGPITSRKTACTTGPKVDRAPTSPRPLPPLTGAAATMAGSTAGRMLERIPPSELPKTK